MSWTSGFSTKSSGGSAVGGIAGAALTPWLGPLAGVAGSLIGGLFGDRGQSAANRANLQIARENREFQERMSNTAYQRAAKDLEAAGLNRILALGSPSSTPSGNTAVMQNTKAQRAAAISNAAHSAMSLRTQQAQIKQIQAQTKNLNVDADLKRATIGKTTKETLKIAADTKNVKLLADQIVEMTRKIVEDTKLTGAKATREQVNVAMYELAPDVLLFLQDVLGLPDSLVDKVLNRVQDAIR